MGKIKWTGYQLDILRKEYPEKGTNIPELRKKFSKSAIVTKAYRLKIPYKYMKRFEHHKWTEEEIDILKEEYPTKGVKIPFLVERHGKGGVDGKARSLGLKCDFAKNEWTEEELKILKKYYPIKGYNIPELLKTRSRSSIIQKAMKLKIKSEKPPERSFVILKEDLYDLYHVQKINLDEISKIYGCSRDTIRKRMLEYNIPIRERRESTIIAKGGLAHLKLNDYTKQVLDGVMISDGYIGIVGKIDTLTGSLVINQAVRNKGWIQELQKIFKNSGMESTILDRKNKLNDKVFDQVSLQSKSYVELGDEWKRWYRNGKKIVPKDINFTLVFLAHWYMGDGYTNKRYNKKLDKNYYRIGFCTDGFTKEEVEYLIKKLKNIYGYNFVLKKALKKYRLVNNHIAEIKDFLFKISPYIVDCFQYKIEALYDPNATIGRKRWTKEQDKILMREYPIRGKNIQELLKQGRTISAIANRVHQLGLKHVRRYWTDDMIQILKEKFPENGSNISELINLDKSKNAIKMKARLIGVKCKYKKNQFCKTKI